MDAIVRVPASFTIGAQVRAFLSYGSWDAVERVEIFMAGWHEVHVRALPVLLRGNVIDLSDDRTRFKIANAPLALTDAQTRFIGVAQVSQISLGTYAEIRGALAPSGDIVAATVSVPSRTVEGRLTDISSDGLGLITVRGMKLNMTAKTQIVEVPYTLRGL